MERFHPSLGQRIETALSYAAESGRQRPLARTKMELVARVPRASLLQLDRWLADRARPDAVQCAHIAAALGVTVEWISTGDRHGEIMAPRKSTVR